MKTLLIAGLIFMLLVAVKGDQSNTEKEINTYLNDYETLCTVDRFKLKGSVGNYGHYLKCSSVYPSGEVAPTIYWVHQYVGNELSRQSTAINSYNPRPRRLIKTATAMANGLSGSIYTCVVYYPGKTNNGDRACTVKNGAVVP